jgi:hypothetical protein
MPERSFSCETCKTLWREYSDATRVALKAAGDRQIAEMAQDSASLAVIEPVYQQAIVKRDTARKAVLDHAAAHPETRAAAQAG